MDGVAWFGWPVGWRGLRWGGREVAKGWKNFGLLLGLGLDLVCIFEKVAMRWPKGGHG